MRRALSALAVLLMLVPAAEAVTLEEIIELKRAGLGEEVLLALIEVDGRVFSIDAATLTRLKNAGVSDRVIQAIVRSGRVRLPEAVPPPVEPETPVAPSPQVVVIEHERPVIQQVPVAVPVYVAVPARGRYRVTSMAEPLDPSPGFGAYIPPSYRSPQKPAAPVYWGWGGKLRPDAWKPAPEKTPQEPAPAGQKKSGSRR